MIIIIILYTFINNNNYIEIILIFLRIKTFIYITYIARLISEIKFHFNLTVILAKLGFNFKGIVFFISKLTIKLK